MNKHIIKFFAGNVIMVYKFFVLIGYADRETSESDGHLCGEILSGFLCESFMLCENCLLGFVQFWQLLFVEFFVADVVATGMGIAAEGAGAVAFVFVDDASDDEKYNQYEDCDDDDVSHALLLSNAFVRAGDVGII